MTPLRPLLPALLALALSACATAPRLDDLGPVRQPANVRGPAAWPASVTRVAVLPAHDASGRLPSDFVAAHDLAWGRALAGSHRAEFVAVSRADLAAWTGRETLDSTSALPPDLLARVAAQTGAQAIVFLDLAHVSPYPPLSLAFRARLVDAPVGATLWTVDENFDLGDPATARAARHEARARAAGAGDPSSALFQSPARLADHAFRSVATLLPPHPAPVAKEPETTKKMPIRADKTR
jgi:hypothetical protein